MTFVGAEFIWNYSKALNNIVIYGLYRMNLLTSDFHFSFPHLNETSSAYGNKRIMPSQSTWLLSHTCE